MTLKKMILTLLCAHSVLLGCSKGSDSDKAPTVDPISNTENLLSDADSAAASRPAAEDLNALKSIVGANLQVANQFLDVADKLVVNKYDFGDSISPEQCEQLEQSISKNYQLHTYEGTPNESGPQTVKGVEICPTRSVRNRSFYIDTKTTWTKLFVGTINNSVGVQATKVLTVSYMPMLDGARSPMLEQYLLDSKNRIVEHVQQRLLSKDAVESWNLVSAMTKKGHLVARVYRTHSDPKSPYIWKAASTFIAGDGSVSPATRVYQNDGKGVEAQKFRLNVPYQVKWSKFELSPLARLGGIYQVNGESLTWLKSKAIYEWNKKGSEECGYGHIGYNKNGGSIREFGEIECEKKLDLNTSIQ